MSFKNSSTSYGWPAQLLHWSVAALIVTQLVLAKLAERAEDNEAKMAQLALLANHKSVGITILMLALVRVCWRFITPPPALPAAMPNWQTQASRLSHFLLYAFLFALPITGWLMSSASAYTVSWFGLFELPDMIAPSKALKKTLHDVHELLAEALFVIALLHIAAAMKHHFVDKDDILRRMISYASFAVFAVLLTAMLWSFATIDTHRSGSETSVETSAKAKANTKANAKANAETSAETSVETNAKANANANAKAKAKAKANAEAAPESIVAPQLPPTAIAKSAENVDASSLVAWDIDYSASSIEFTAEQAGANFTGAWPAWQAEMFFDQDALAQSKFDVRIDVTRVNSRDEERDETLMEPEWFDSGNFPEARFVARKFDKNQDASFTAQASLTIKGFGAPVEFNFTIDDTAEKKVLVGTAHLDRLALKVGTGEWTDLEWVGQYVDVKVRVEAKLSDAK